MLTSSMSVTRGSQTVPVSSTSPASQAIGTISGSGTNLDGTEAPFLFQVDERAGRQGVPINPDTATGRVELSYAAKTGHPACGRSAAGYTMTGNGSTDDVFYFAPSNYAGSYPSTFTVRTIFMVNNTAGVIYLYWGLGATGVAAAVGDIPIIGGNEIISFPFFADWVSINAPAGTVLNSTASSGGIIFFGGI